MLGFFIGLVIGSIAGAIAAWKYKDAAIAKLKKEIADLNGSL